MTDTPTASKPKRSIWLTIAIAAAILVVGLVIALKILYARADDKTKNVLNVLGVSVEPWNKRADAAAHAIVTQLVAESIMNVTHPTGKDPTLGAVTTRDLGEDRMAVDITVNWKGGIMGKAYQTKVEWIFNKTVHETAKVVADDAIIGIAKDNLTKLNEYFMQSVYPPMKHNIN